MQSLFKILGYAMLAGILSYFAVKLYFKSNTVEKGEIAPSIHATLIDNSSFDLEKLRGKWVLIDFWGSWCGPCIREYPDMVNLYKITKGSNFEIVSIALEKDKLKGIAATNQLGLPWKYQIIEENRFVMFSPIAQSYGVTDIPAKFLISPSGIVQKIEDLNTIPGLIQ